MCNRFTIVLPLCCLLLPLGCVDSTGNPEVVVYSALDREFSEPILNDYGQDAGVHVRVKYDVESTKTVQLVTRIQNERRPTCDVFWNNEIIHTLRLHNEGRLDAFFPVTADQIPTSYRSATGEWYGLAARARVLIVNTDLLALEERPDSIHDLADPQWRGKVGIAKPMFGTTATHAAVLFAMWGREQAERYYRDVLENAQILSGNKQVAAAVGRGQLVFGITDTDDAIIERDNGRPVAIVFPDQGADQIGTLFIPNTLCIIRGGPHPEEARRLVEHLLSHSVESRLAEGRSAQFPVNRTVKVSSRVLSEGEPRWMDVDFELAAEAWTDAMTFLRDRVRE